MRVAAVIPAWNARHRLAEVIGGVADQVAEVIVVDNGSRDGTAEWLAGRSDRVVCVGNSRNRGYAAAVNQGIDLALDGGDGGAGGVLLVNDDAVFSPGAVDALVAALGANDAAGAVSARLHYRDRAGVLNGTGGAFEMHRGWAALRGAGEVDRDQYDARPIVDYPSGAASLLRREAIEDVGRFDERYFLYFEDTDWGLRARRAGWQTRYAPDALVVHVGSAGTARDPARRRYYNVRNRLLLASEHASRRGRCWTWLATAGLLAKQPARWCWASRRRDAEAVLWGVMDHLRGRYGRSIRFG